MAEHWHDLVSPDPLELPSPLPHNDVLLTQSLHEEDDFSFLRESIELEDMASPTWRKERSSTTSEPAFAIEAEFQSGSDFSDEEYESSEESDADSLFSPFRFGQRSQQTQLNGAQATTIQEVEEELPSTLEGLQQAVKALRAQKRAMEEELREKDQTLVRCYGIIARQNHQFKLCSELDFLLQHLVETIDLNTQVLIDALPASTSSREAKLATPLKRLEPEQLRLPRQQPLVLPPPKRARSNKRRRR